MSARDLSEIILCASVGILFILLGVAIVVEVLKDKKQEDDDELS